MCGIHSYLEALQCQYFLTTTWEPLHRSCQKWPTRQPRRTVFEEAEKPLSGVCFRLQKFFKNLPTTQFTKKKRDSQECDCPQVRDLRVFGFQKRNHKNYKSNSVTGNFCVCSFDSNMRLCFHLLLLHTKDEIFFSANNSDKNGNYLSRRETGVVCGPGGTDSVCRSCNLDTAVPWSPVMQDVPRSASVSLITNREDCRSAWCVLSDSWLSHRMKPK